MVHYCTNIYVGNILPYYGNILCDMEIYGVGN
jgi:hypothetical protein